MKQRNEQGSSYAVVLIFVSCLTILIGSLALTSANYGKMSSNVADGSKAFYIADAGLKEGTWWVGARQRSPELWKLPAAKDKPDYPFPIKRSFFGGKYVVTVSAAAPDGSVDITSVGTYNDAQRTATATLRPYGFALFSKNALSLGKTPTTPLEAAADGDLVIVDRGIIGGMKFHLSRVQYMNDPVAGRTAEGRNVLDDYAAIMGASTSVRPVDPYGYVEILLGVLNNVRWNYVVAKRKGRAFITNPDSKPTFQDVVGAFFATRVRRTRHVDYEAYRERLAKAASDLTNEQARQALLKIVSYYPYDIKKYGWKCPRALKHWDRFTILDIVGRFLDTRRARKESHKTYAARLKRIIEHYNYQNAERSLREENAEFWNLVDPVGLCEKADVDTRQEWLEKWVTQFPFTYYAKNQKPRSAPNLLDAYGAMLRVRRHWDAENDTDYQKRLIAALDHDLVQIYGNIHSNQKIWTCDATDQLNQNAIINLHGTATQVAEGDPAIALGSVDYAGIRKRAEADAKATGKQHVWTVAQFQALLRSTQNVRLTGVHYVYLPGKAAQVYVERPGGFRPSQLALRKVGGSLKVEGCLAFDIPGHPSAKVRGCYLVDGRYKPLPAVKLNCDVFLTPGSVKRGNVTTAGPDAEDLPVLASSGIPLQFGPSFDEYARPARALLFLLRRFRYLAMSHVPAPNGLDRLGRIVGVARRTDEGNYDYYSRVRAGVYDRFDDSRRVMAAILREKWEEGLAPFASRDDLADTIAKWLGRRRRQRSETGLKFLARLAKEVEKAPDDQKDVRLYLQGQIHSEGLVAIFSRPEIPRVFGPRKRWVNRKTYDTDGSVTAFGSIIAGGLYIERCSTSAQYFFKSYGASRGLQLTHWSAN